MSGVSYRVHLILAGAWRRRYLIITPIILLPIMGFVVGKSVPKQYQAHTSMLIQETAKMNPFLEDLAVSSMLEERISALQTLLHSRHILSSVATERGLIDETMTTDERDRQMEKLSSALNVSMLGKELIRIDYKSSKPDDIKAILESVSAHFIEQLLAPERSSITDSAAFLSKSLEDRRQELDAAEQALADYKSEHGSELPELYGRNMERLVELQQLLSEKQAELVGAEQSLNSIDKQLSQTNPVLGRIEEQIVNIRSDLVLLRTQYTDSHSSVQAALRKLKSLEHERQQVLQQGEHQIDANQMWQIASQTATTEKSNDSTLLVSQLQLLQEQRSRYTSLDKEVERLQEMVDELEAKTADFGKHEQMLLKLDRDLKVKRKLYDELLERYEMARVTGSLGKFEETKRVRVIDQPFTPTVPNNLPIVVFVVGGVFAGLALGIGLATMLELMDNTIRRREQVEKLVGVPVLSRLPPITH